MMFIMDTAMIKTIFVKEGYSVFPNQMVRRYIWFEGGDEETTLLLILKCACVRVCLCI